MVGVNPGGLADSHEVVALSPDGTDQRTVVTFDDSSTDWFASPDGTRIAAIPGWEGGLRLVDAGTGETIWSGLQGRAIDFRAAWSPDSSRFAFVEFVEYDEYGDSLVQLAAAPRDGGDIDLITEPERWYDQAGFIWPPSWSTDGNSIACGAPVRVFDVASGAEQEPPVGGELLRLQWAAQGDRALAMTDAALLSIDSDGGEPAELEPSLPLGISPDGNWMIGLRVVDDHVAMFATSLTDSTETELWSSTDTYGSMSDLPSLDAAWSPLSDRVAVVDVENSTVSVIDVKTGDATEILSLSPGSGWFTGYVDWVAGPPGSSTQRAA